MLDQQPNPADYHLWRDHLVRARREIESARQPLQMTVPAIIGLLLSVVGIAFLPFFLAWRDRASRKLAYWSAEERRARYMLTWIERGGR